MAHNDCARKRLSRAPLRNFYPITRNRVTTTPFHAMQRMDGVGARHPRSVKGALDRPEAVGEGGLTNRTRERRARKLALRPRSTGPVQQKRHHRPPALSGATLDQRDSVPMDVAALPLFALFFTALVVTTTSKYEVLRVSIRRPRVFQLAAVGGGTRIRWERIRSGQRRIHGRQCRGGACDLLLARLRDQCLITVPPTGAECDRSSGGMRIVAGSAPWTVGGGCGRASTATAPSTVQNRSGRRTAGFESRGSATA